MAIGGGQPAGREYRFERLKVIYAASCICVFIAMSFGTFAFVKSKLASSRDITKASIEHAAALAQEVVDHVFGDMNWAMICAQLLLQQSSKSSEDIKAELSRLINKDGFPHQISILDGSGRFIVSNISTVPGLDLSDREHVRQVLRPDGPDVYVSRPLEGRVSKKSTINVGKRIRDKDGAIVNVVVVSFLTDKFIGLLDKMRGSQDVGVAIVRADGAGIIAVRPGSVENVGDAIKQREFNEANLLGGEATNRGLFIADSRSFRERPVERRLNTEALRVITWSDVNPWPQEVRLEAVMGVFWTLLLGTLLAAGYVVLGRTLAMEIAMLRNGVMVQEARRIRSVADAAVSIESLFVCIFDRDGSLLYNNEASLTLFAAIPAKFQTPLAWINGASPVAHDGSFSGVREFKDAHGHTKLISWTISGAEWVGPGASIAFGIDWSDLIEAERELQQKLQMMIAGEMARGIAHELAQPATAIKFELSLVRKIGGAECTESLDAIASAVSRVEKVIDRLKFMSRRSLSSDNAFFNIGHSLSNIKNVLEGGMHRHRVRCAIDPQVADVWCRGGDVIFEQAILGIILYGDGFAMRQGSADGEEDWLYCEIETRSPVTDRGGKIYLRIIDERSKHSVSASDGSRRMMMSGHAESGSNGVDRICLDMLKGIGMECDITSDGRRRILTIVANAPAMSEVHGESQSLVVSDGYNVQ